MFPVANSHSGMTALPYAHTPDPGNDSNRTRQRAWETELSFSPQITKNFVIGTTQHSQEVISTKRLAGGGNTIPRRERNATLLTGDDLSTAGDMLAAEGHHKQALVLYMSADEITADQADMRNVIRAGKSLMALGHFKEAKEAFTLASRQNLVSGRDQSAQASNELAALLNAAEKPVQDPVDLQNALPKTQKNEFDIEFLLCSLSKLRQECSKLQMNALKGQLEENRDTRAQLIEKKLLNLEARNKAKLEADAAREKTTFWQKLSKITGIVTAVIGIALAPFTGGLSLLATAYLVVDLGLELGEQISGVKMSIQSGLLIVCQKVVELVLSCGKSEEYKANVAAILAIFLNVVIAVVATVVSVGTAVPKLLDAVKSLIKVSTGSLVVVSKVVQGGTVVAAGATAIYTGKCSVDTANAGFEVTGREAEKVGLGKVQVSLEKVFALCGDGLMLLASESQRDREILAEIVSAGMENRKKTSNALFQRLAA
jgi:tetratricopeptide (TPR) repeat protein